MVKNLPANAGRYNRCELDPWVGKICWRRACQPLQYSWLENPRFLQRMGLKRGCLCPLLPTEPTSWLHPRETWPQWEGFWASRGVWCPVQPLQSWLHWAPTAGIHPFDYLHPICQPGGFLQSFICTPSSGSKPGSFRIYVGSAWQTPTGNPDWPDPSQISFFFKYLFTWLWQFLVAGLGIFDLHCGM